MGSGARRNLPEVSVTAHREDDLDRDMWDRYVKGWTQREIGDHYGITQQAVSDRLRRYRASLPEDDLIQRRKAHLDAAQGATRALHELVAREGVPVAVGKDGDPLFDPDTGAVVRDYSARIKALSELRAWQEREAKLLGLDSPTKVDLNATVVQASAVDAEIEELSHLLGMNDPSEVTEPAK